MTLDVYAQLEHRAKRDHGARFDDILRADDEEPDAEDGSESDEE